MRLQISIILLDNKWIVKKSAEITLQAEHANLPIGETVQAAIESMVDTYMDELSDSDAEAKKQVAEVKPE